METALLVIILIVLLIRWLVLSGRLDDLEHRIEALGGEKQESPRIAALTARVYALEQALKGVAAEPAVVPEPAPQPVAEPVTAAAIEVIETPPVMPPPLPPELPAPVIAAPPSPTMAERLREKMSGEEWEAIVGGSWLNKLGVFVLVVGVALFLGYSFTQFGPAGRAAIAMAVSLTMLGGGAWLESRARYRTFGRGLLGGGWAALYFTVYAMQAVDAARVIHNALAGGALLLTVAAGMIAHSLRYRSQTVAGLAYFAAFVTLAMTASTPFSVAALIPLAASLLYVAYRFEWSEMALFGVVATYGTCASRGDSGAPLWTAQTLFAIYWLLFEGFDVLRAARRSTRPAESAILPLNALAFTGLSYAKWSAAAPHYLYVLAAAIAGAYLASAVLRARVRPPSSFAAEARALDRILGGGYEGPVTLTATLSAAAVLLRFHGGWATTGLLLEAELLFLAGLWFRESYPRHVAASLFAFAAGKILAIDIPAGGAWRQLRAWTPSAAAAGALFYLNRALRRNDKFYGYAGAAMFALIVGFESPERFLGLYWLLLAASVFAFGWWRRLQDFRFQGYGVAALGVLGVAIHQMNVAWGVSAASRHPWIALSCAAVLAYAAVFCALRSAADRLGDAERDALRFVASWGTTVALMALVWRVAPAQYAGVGWLAAALPILELGIRGIPAEFRRQAYAVAAVGACWVLFANVLPVHNDGPVQDRLTAAFAALLAYAFAARVYAARCAVIPEAEAVTVTNAGSSAGTVFALTALWALLPAPAVGPAWAALSLLLLETGLALDMPGVRLQAHASGAAAFGRLFLANFANEGATGGISHRLLTVIPVIAAQYYSWSRQRTAAAPLRHWERPLARVYLYSAAVLGCVLMRFELGRSMVAAGWALFALALIALGRRWNNSDLRWQSYAIAALAFFRSWTTDFYDPGTLAGAPARIAIGAFVIACFFTAQLLLPQSRPRVFYSLLATVLLTIVLFHEVTGSVLTVAWGAEGVALLAAGFPLRDRTLRLSGLALFLLCILKLFVYDLRNLETMYRILSFIVLGLIMVSVSWIYTRFRDQLNRYL